MCINNGNGSGCSFGLKKVADRRLYVRCCAFDSTLVDVCWGDQTLGAPHKTNQERGGGVGGGEAHLLNSAAEATLALD